MDSVAAAVPWAGGPFAAEPFIRRALAGVAHLRPCQYSTSHDAGKRALDAVLLREAARRAGIEVQPLSEYTSLFRHNGTAWLTHKNMPSTLSALDRAVTNHKHLTKQVLAGKGLPVARGHLVTALADAQDVFARAPGPVVVKPVAGSGGRGVTVGITTTSELEAAYEAASGKGAILIEEMFAGIDLRIMTVGGRAVASSLRVPANVVGDGQRTVRQLIEAKNAYRARNPYTRHSPITVVRNTHDLLASQGLGLNDVPPRRRRIFLQSIANVSGGGDCYEVHRYVHPDLLWLAEQAVSCFPTATHAGMDILAERLDVGLDAQRAIVCEVNLNNEIPMHVMPAYGSPTNVHDLLIEASPPARVKRQERVASPPPTVDLDELEDRLVTASHSFDPLPENADGGRERDLDELRAALIRAGYQDVVFRGALIFLTRGSCVQVTHRTGRSVVAAIVAREPDTLHGLAKTVGVPVLDESALARMQPPTAVTCRVLFIDHVPIATVIEHDRPRLCSGPFDAREAARTGETEAPTAVRLPGCPYRELGAYAIALTRTLGDTPVLEISFGLQPSRVHDRWSWALWRIDADPVLARFAHSESDGASICDKVVNRILSGGAYVLPNSHSFE